MAWSKTGNIRPPTFGAPGQITTKRWIGSALTNASGDAVFNIGAANFANAPSLVNCSALASDATAANAVHAYPSAVSKTSVTISVTKPVTLLALGLTQVKAAAGVTVYLEVEGT